MANNKAEKTHFISFDPRQIEPFNFVHIEIERNQEYINKMLNRIDMAEYAIQECINNNKSLNLALQEAINLEQFSL